jgi:hypothetical protein
MQLRVARLCLDCEELHVEDACPICASERYAFLSSWLPSEERRRWRRGPPRRPAAATAPAAVRAWHRVRQWLGVPVTEPPPGPRTRASDHVPELNFDEPAPGPKDAPRLDPQPAQVSRESGS